MGDPDKQISLGARIFGLVDLVLDPNLLKITSQPPATQNNNGSDHGNVCSTKGLSDKTNNPDAAIPALVRLNVHPDTFLIEDGSARFKSLTSCTTKQKTDFITVENKIAETIRKNTKNPSDVTKIGKKLEALYKVAYRYDMSRHSMVLTKNIDNVDEPTKLKGRKAKKELDLWIAAINHVAYKDKQFLDKVWKEPRIRRVMALNSPHMLPKDRTDFHRLEAAKKLGDGELRKEMKRRSVSVYKRTFNWLKNYKGQAHPLKQRFWRSQADFEAASHAVFGKDKYQTLKNESYPEALVETLIDDYDRNSYQSFRAKYNSLKDPKRFSNDQLAYIRSQQWPGLISKKTNPQIRKGTFESHFMTSLILDSRKLSSYDRLSMNYHLYLKKGHRIKDAGIFLATEETRYDGTRIDDYKIRSAALEEFEPMYRRFLRQPRKDRFNEFDDERYGRWEVMMNRSVSEIPITAADLKQIRAKVRREVNPTTDGPISKADFNKRDLEKIHWFTPAEMGIGGGPADGAFSYSAKLFLTKNYTVSDLIADHVEDMVFMPGKLMFKRENGKPYYGFALPIMGVIVMTNDFLDKKDAMGGGEGYNTLAHEGQHNRSWEKSSLDNPKFKDPDVEHDGAWEVGDLAQVHYLEKYAEPQEIAQFKAAYGKMAQFKDLRGKNKLMQAYYLAKYASPQEIANFKAIYGNEKYLKLKRLLRKLYYQSLTKK